jgi:hypothetical protein
MKTLIVNFLLTIFLLGSLHSNAQVVGAGNAVDFTSSYMTAPHDPVLNPGLITLEAWIKADTWATNVWENVIISKDGWATGNQGYTLRAGANGTLSFNFAHLGSWHEVNSTPQMLAGRWYHVAGTYDGSMMRIYINGVEVGSSPYSGFIEGGNYDLNIGKIAYTSGGFRYFDGQIEEVRIWNTALPQAQLKDYMCQKMSPAHPSYASLLAQYSFDGTDLLLDGSPNTHNLSNFGAVQVVSAAPIGDESVHQYGGPYNVSLAYGTIDSIQVQSSNSLSTIHLYRIDSAPVNLTANAAIDSMDYTHYYGIFPASSASYNYTLKYYYTGNPTSIGNEVNLNLAGRANATTPIWVPQNATVNQTLGTVNKTLSAGMEVMLAIACKNINLSVSGNQSLCSGEMLTASDLVANTNYQWHNASGPIAAETTSTYTISTTGDYYLVANSGLCVDTSSTINVTVNPLPTVDFGTLSSTHCENDVTSEILNPSPVGGTYSGTGILGTDFSPSAAGDGTYTLYYNYTDGNGCSGVDSMVVSVYPQPVTPIINDNGGVLCVTNGEAGATYEWFLNGTSVFTSGNPCFTPTLNGTYTVITTSTFSCESEEGTATVSGIGLSEISSVHLFTVSPNPTNGLVEVDLSSIPGERTVSLADVNGKILETVVSSNTSVAFNLSIYEAGVYLIVLESDGQKAIERVVKN